MPKRRQILLLLAAGLLVFVLWALLARNREPSFQGRSLTQWLTICQMRWPDGVKPNQIEQAEQAVRHIGTNALPHYLKCIAYEPAPWQKSLSRLIDRLPDRFELNPDCKFLINPGSVGQPRDSDCRSCYALLEIEGNQKFFTLRRVFYDIDATATAIRQAGLPNYLAERLYRGE